MHIHVVKRGSHAPYPCQGATHNSRPPVLRFSLVKAGVVKIEDKMKRISALFLLLTLGIGTALALPSYTGYSGAPGRQTCASSCHGSSSGTVTITGFPEFYSPGTPYTITIARNGGNTIRNFNGSCRQGTGTSNAGTLSGGQGTSTYNTNGETNGIHLSSNGQASATFTWTAPSEGTGEVRLYIGAYQGNSTNGQTTALSLVSAEGDPAVPELVWDSMALSSDSDGDGLPEGGETVAFSVTLRNTGSMRLNNVSGAMESASPVVQLLQPFSEWSDIPAGQTRTSATDFSLVIDPSITQDQLVPFVLTVQTDEGEVQVQGEMTVLYSPPLPPDLGARDAVLLSDEDGDGFLEAGELGTISLSLENYGSQPLSGLQVTLLDYNPWMEVVSGTSTCPDLDPHQVAALATPFVVRISADSPPIRDEVLVMHVQCEQGEGDPMLRIPLGHRESVWSDDMESGVIGWSHEAAEGWGDQWQLLEAGSGSPTHAWRCGPLDGVYENHLDARLMTPPIRLLPWSRLEIQHSMVAETSTAYPDSAYDGGVVEISIDAGTTWEQLLPLGAYSHSARWLTGAGNPTTHPFPGGTPCYSGNIGWETITFDLSAYGDSIDAILRFRFGADDGGGFTGWTLDDVKVYGLHVDEVAVEPTSRPTALALEPAFPNPFNPATQVAWTQSRAGRASVLLFDVAGRQVRLVLDEERSAGRHQLQVDGGDLPSGVYLLRVEAAGEWRSQKITLLK